MTLTAPFQLTTDQDGNTELTCQNVTLARTDNNGNTSCIVTHIGTSLFNSFTYVKGVDITDKEGRPVFCPRGFLPDFELWTTPDAVCNAFKQANLPPPEIVSIRNSAKKLKKLVFGMGSQ